MSFQRRMSSNDIKECRATFDMFDKNGNGTINAQELFSVMRSLGIKSSLKEAQGMIQEVDHDKSGLVDFNEFLSLMANKKSSKRQESFELMHAFKAFDRNNDGYIVKSEFMKVMKKHGEKITSKEIDSMIKQCDVDKDGKINYTEFVKMVR